MVTRRTILLAPLALAGQSPRPRVQIVWINTPVVPEEFARDSVVFPRAYVACPAQGLSRRALETGRFPHAARPQDRSLIDLAGTSEPAVGAEAITILTAESGDGQDSPSQKSVQVPLAIRWPGILKPPFLSAGRRQSFRVRASSFAGDGWLVSAAGTMFKKRVSAAAQARCRGFIAIANFAVPDGEDDQKLQDCLDR